MPKSVEATTTARKPRKSASAATGGMVSSAITRMMPTSWIRKTTDRAVRIRITVVTTPLLTPWTAANSASKATATVSW